MSLCKKNWWFLCNKKRAVKRGGKESKESKESKEVRDIRDIRDVREVREIRGLWKVPC